MKGNVLNENEKGSWLVQSRLPNWAQLHFCLSLFTFGSGCENALNQGVALALPATWADLPRPASLCVLLFLPPIPWRNSSQYINLLINSKRDFCCKWHRWSWIAHRLGRVLQSSLDNIYCGNNVWLVVLTFPFNFELNYTWISSVNRNYTYSGCTGTYWMN